MPYNQRSYGVKIPWNKGTFTERIWCTNRLLWHTNSAFYGIRTPTFMPHEPFSLGGGGGLEFVEPSVATSGCVRCFWARTWSGPSKPCFFQSVFLSRGKFWGDLWAVSPNSLSPPFPHAKAGRAIRIPRCAFHVQKLQPQPTPLKSSLGWHVSSLVGSWEAEGRPCQKRCIFDENGEIDVNPNNACFYRVRAPDWRKWRNWRKHPEIGGARSSTTLMQIGALGPESGRG